jgi:hypothetical protein
VQRIPQLKDNPTPGNKAALTLAQTQHDAHVQRQIIEYRYEYDQNDNWTERTVVRRQVVDSSESGERSKVYRRPLTDFCAYRSPTKLAQIACLHLRSWPLLAVLTLAQIATLMVASCLFCQFQQMRPES